MNELRFEEILGGISQARIAVVGDLFLDRWLDVDPALTFPSLETGIDAYQVVGGKAQAGAAGTVLNNLAAIGVKTVYAVSMIG